MQENVQSRLLPVVRRPGELIAVISEPDATIRFETLDRVKRSLYPGKERLQESWRHLADVKAADEDTLYHVLVVAIESVPDLSVATARPPLPLDWGAARVAAKATGAHPRTFKGTKYQPPKGSRPAPNDVRPHLCDLKSMHALLAPMRRFLPRVQARLERSGYSSAIARQSKANSPWRATRTAGVAYKPSSAVVNPAALPARTEIWVMQPAADSTAVNAASYAAGTPVGRGSIVSVFGSNRGSQVLPAASYPLPPKLGETEVLVAGSAVPLYYASSGQINFQAPGGLKPGQALLDVHIGGQSVSHGVLTVVPNAPGVFVAANADFRVNSAAQPARSGEVLHIFGTGQGAVTPAVADGAAGDAQTLSKSVATHKVLLGGQPVSVLFSGLAPGIVGLWQVDIAIPNDANTGNPVPLTVESTLVSNQITIAVSQ